MSSSDDEYTDSEDELEAGVQTTVQLGLPDGPMESGTHLLNPTYSRFGGQPVLLTAHPPPTDVANCKNCAEPMELVAQLWCPLEESPLDRVLYMWACSRGTCQRKAGCVRAWRAVRYNAKYAEKLERKRKQREERAAAKAAKPAAPASNPFSMSATNNASSGLGSQIFGGFGDDDENDGGISDEEGTASGTASEDEDAAQAAVEAVQKLKLSDDVPQTWLSPTPHPVLYVKTVGEYLPAPAPEPDDKVLDDVSGGKEDKELKWAMEAYENSMKLDNLFERFLKRVTLEPQQCIRYDFGGAPLPYQADSIYDQLFPSTPAPGTAVPVTRAGFAVDVVAPRRSFDASRLPRCPHCDAPRAFECQLMPNVINIFKPSAAQKQTDEERKAELQRVLARQGVSDSRSGMEWGTCMIFSCSKDCSSGTDPVAVWREEHVLVQWDD
ncbi:hypothetical protein AURDEDRAFT_111031 [Auricularia subglabra TFB-10046 SS5]|nr:hypothetical protein AURDEDRAFT_111031 [Auricularia subglabra TFB-10046 SS5]